VLGDLAGDFEVSIFETADDFERGLSFVSTTGLRVTGPERRSNCDAEQKITAARKSYDNYEHNNKRKKEI
jgi:hypothetical protein